MTEYELAYLISETTFQYQQIVTNIFTFLSGFLLASYLIAHQLTRKMSAVLIVLYLGLMIPSIMLLHRGGDLLQQLTVQVKKMALEGHGLEWHPAAQNSELLSNMGPLIIVAIASFATIGSLYFFWLRRREQKMFD